jgi:UMP-CMP kinase
MKDGKIVPVEITCGLAKKVMESHGKVKIYYIYLKSDIFLIDGFPRNKSNLEGWLQEFGNECIIMAVLFLDCSEDTCISRINVRKISSGRIDDNTESIKKRFKTFQDETIPNLIALKEVTNVIGINSEGDRESVFEDICKNFNKLLQN